MLMPIKDHASLFWHIFCIENRDRDKREKKESNTMPYLYLYIYGPKDHEQSS